MENNEGIIMFLDYLENKPAKDLNESEINLLIDLNRLETREDKITFCTGFLQGFRIAREQGGIVMKQILEDIRRGNLKYGS